MNPPIAARGRVRRSRRREKYDGSHSWRAGHGAGTTIRSGKPTAGGCLPQMTIPPVPPRCLIRRRGRGSDRELDECEIQCVDRRAVRERDDLVMAVETGVDLPLGCVELGESRAACRGAEAGELQYIPG